MELKATVKTEEDHVADREERLRMLEQYNESLEKKKHDMELWINDNKERNTLVFLWYADCRKASEKIFRDTQTMRQHFFDKWAADLAAVPNKDKKGTGKK